MAYAVDVSGSTESAGNDCNSNGAIDDADDFNGDGIRGTILDCEIAGTIALNASLRSRQPSPPVSVIPFGSSATLADMDPGASDETRTLSTADADSDAIPDVQQVVASLATGIVRRFSTRPTVGGGTSFAAPLDQFRLLIDSTPVVAGERQQLTLFFLSDGQANYPSAEVQALKQAAASRTDLLPPVVHTVSVGSGATGCGTGAVLRQIADELGGVCTAAAPGALQAALGSQLPEGLDRITVQLGSGAPVLASIDALGGWTARFEDVAANLAGYPWTVTAHRTDGTTVAVTGTVRVVAGTFEYAALGDSFSSGWGLVPYTGIADAACGRSRQASAYFVRIPGESTPIVDGIGRIFRFPACGGAISLDLVGRTQHPTELGPQIAALRGETDLTTLTVGGNDAKFSAIMTACGMPVGGDCQNEPYLTLNSGRTLTLDEYAALRLTLLQADVLDSFRRVRERAPNATVLVSDYPNLISEEAPGACQEKLGLSQGERNWINRRTGHLSTLIQDAAARAGVYFTSVRDDFAAHEKCGGGEDWMYGLEASAKQTGAQDETCGTKQVSVFGKTFSRTLCFYSRSFHPNRLGTRAYANAYSDELTRLSNNPPNGRTRTGLPRNPAPTLPVARRALRATGLSSEEEAEVRGFTVDVGDANDLAGVDAHAVPPSCPDQLRALPGQLLVATGDGFSSGSPVQMEVRIGARKVELNPTAANSDGIAGTMVLLPSELSENDALLVSFDGNAPDGSHRRVTTVIVSGAASTQCIAEQRSAGLLSPDGVALPAAAGPSWPASKVATLTDQITAPPTATPSALSLSLVRTLARGRRITMVARLGEPAKLVLRAIRLKGGKRRSAGTSRRSVAAAGIQRLRFTVPRAGRYLFVLRAAAPDGRAGQVQVKRRVKG